MPGYDKIPTYLNPEQRHALTQIPPDLSDRDLARYYTFTKKERDLINRRRRLSNRAADIWVPFGKPQIIGANEEALYVIDALCHHESDLHI